MLKGWGWLVIATTLANGLLFAQRLGIGVKLGEPTGITLKFYQSASNFDLSFGRTGWWGWAWNAIDRIERKFTSQYDDVSVDYAYYARPLYIQGIYHFVFRDLNIPDFPNVFVELGIGAQANFSVVRYGVWLYRNNWGWRYESGTLMDIDVGPVLSGGIDWWLTEYDIPLGISLNGTIFFEMFDVPMGRWYIGTTLGIRYLLD